MKLPPKRLRRLPQGGALSGPAKPDPRRLLDGSLQFHASRVALVAVDN